MASSSLCQSAVALGAVAALTMPASQAAVYSLKDLGVLTDQPPRELSGPFAINAQGQVVGSNVTNGAYRAVLFGDGWTNLGTLGGAESFGSGLNDAGQVVGSALTASGFTRAFLWTPGGTDGVLTNPQMKDLGTLGGDHSEAYGINHSGQISGYSDAGRYQRAFRYSAGVMTDIGLLPNRLPNSFGYGINDAGHIAGTAYNEEYTRTAAFYYDGSTAVEIGGLGGEDASALALNNGERIVGYASIAGGVDHAFVYHGGTMRDLGTLGGNYSYALSINNSNVIVGGSFVDTNNSIYHAFICVSNVMSDLNAQVDATASGWTLLDARAINDAGQITGIGNYGGVNRVFLLYRSAPTISHVQVSNLDVRISFTTLESARYQLESRPGLTTGMWSDVLTNIPGTGDIVTAIHTNGAALPSRFYRVRLSSP